MFNFPQIAATTQRLRVCARMLATIKDRDDVVQLQMLSGATVGADRILPLASLAWRELHAMPTQLWCFMETMLFAAWKRSQHLGTMFVPQTAGGFRNALLGFVTMAIAQTVTIAELSAFSHGREMRLGLSGMTVVPEVIERANHARTQTLLRAGVDCATGDLAWTSVEPFAADLAVELLACPHVFTRHDASTAHGVNSKKHSYFNPKYESTLSQASAETLMKVQRLGTEATATHGYASNVPTSALPEREDIVWTTGRPVEAMAKLRRANILDDVLDTQPADGITMAFYDWRQAAVPISISGLEMKKNRGEAKLLDLLEAKTKQAELGIQTFFNQRMLQGAGGSTIQTSYTSTINGAVFIDPIAMQVAFDPTAALTVGNIPQSTNTWWRNKTADGTADTTFAKFLQKLRHLRNDCSKGPGGPPDLHLLDQGTAELYEAALAAAHRNPSYQVADIPFDNVAFYGKPVTWDEYVPDAGSGTVTQTKGSWYMLNSKFWGIKVDKETNFAPGPFVKPENQDAKVAHVLWLGAMGCSNRRKNGVYGKIDTTITS